MNFVFANIWPLKDQGVYLYLIDDVKNNPRLKNQTYLKARDMARATLELSHMKQLSNNQDK